MLRTLFPKVQRRYEGFCCARELEGFGAWLMASGYSREDTCDLCGVSGQTVSMLERTKVSPSLELAFKIARVFGVAVEDIFVDEPDPEGVNPFQDGAIIEIRFEEPSGGKMDSEGDGEGM